MNYSYQHLSTPKEAERLLNVSSQTLRKMCREGSIAFITLPGGHRRVDAVGYLENGPMRRKEENQNA